MMFYVFLKLKVRNRVTSGRKFPLSLSRKSNKKHKAKRSVFFIKPLSSDYKKDISSIFAIELNY